MNTIDLVRVTGILYFNIGERYVSIPFDSVGGLRPIHRAHEKRHGTSHLPALKGRTGKITALNATAR